MFISYEFIGSPKFKKIWSLAESSLAVKLMAEF